MNSTTAFQVARLRGIPIRIHFTFLLVLPFLAYSFGHELVKPIARKGRTT